MHSHLIPSQTWYDDNKVQMILGVANACYNGHCICEIICKHSRMKSQIANKSCHVSELKLFFKMLSAMNMSLRLHC